MKTRNVDWHEKTDAYVKAMKNPYHKHRMNVLLDMIPDLREGMHILDFGCGEGTFLPFFLNSGVQVTACDKEERMIQETQKRLRSENYILADSRLQIGGVEILKKIPDASLDGIIALNVLAYFSPEEEDIFYTQAQRIIRPKGFLLVSHSNTLFDFFSLNRYTQNFFEQHLLLDSNYASQLPSLISRTDLPAGDKAMPLPIRENPLNYSCKLARYQFKEERQEYINRHEAPPPILKERTFPDTLNISPEEKWKLLFTCTQFASLAFRK